MPRWVAKRGSRARFLFMATCAVLALGAGFIVWFLATVDDRIEAARTLAAHVYPANGAEQLTEARALELLPDMLERAGMEPDDWSVLEDDRAAAPDGTPEKYLLRNTINPNRGVIQLRRRTDADGARLTTPITLVVELHDGSIEARLWLDK